MTTTFTKRGVYMSKEYKKCYYIAATVNDKSYYVECEKTDDEIDQFINHFDIADFMTYADEEFAPQCDNDHYVVYRQAMLSTDQAVDLGVATKTYHTDDSDMYTVSYDYPGGDIAKSEKDRVENLLQAEIVAQTGNEDGLICCKRFA
jgi:hypothetical protein